MYGFYTVPPALFETDVPPLWHIVLQFKMYSCIFLQNLNDIYSNIKYMISYI